MAQFVVLVILGALVPIGIMRMLAPRLARSAPRVRNYRGREVFGGLGIVWVVWVACLLLAGLLIELVLGARPTWISTLSKAAPLVIGACALGMFDDLAGKRDRAKGFRGHLAALRHGEVTTGLLKLAGIGVLGLVTAAQISGEPAWTLSYVAGLLLRAAVMALCANEINLFDLRPARSRPTWGSCSCRAPSSPCSLRAPWASRPLRA